MDKQLAGLQVTYADAMELFDRSENEDEKKHLYRDEAVVFCELPPKHFMCIHGIYVDKQKTEGVWLTRKEKHLLLDHPEGDPRKPCLEFPCKLWQLKEFLEEERTNEWIDPFEMANWVRGKLSNSASMPPASCEQEKPSHILTVAVLLKLLKASNEPRYNQAGIIKSIVDGDDGHVRGLSQGNLESMFGAANKALEEARKNSLP